MKEKLKPLALPNTGKNRWKEEWAEVREKARHAFDRRIALPEAQYEALQEIA